MSTAQDPDLVSLAARLAILETEIIEQEHRPFTVLTRFFIDRRNWPVDDPRRAASIRALIWSAFFSPVAIAIGGTIIGFASIAVLVWQNLLIQEQTLKQDRLGVEERRSNAIRLIYQNEYAKDPPIRAQALRELAVLAFEVNNEIHLAVDRAFFRAAGFGNDQSLGFDSEYQLSDEQLKGQFFNGLKGVHLDSANLSRIFITNLKLDDAIFVNTNFSNSRFQFASFQRARFLEKTKLTEARILYSDLSNADFHMICAAGMDLTGSNLSEANFSGDLRNTRWLGVKNWRQANFSGALLEGALDTPEGFLDFALVQGASIKLHDDSAMNCAGVNPTNRNPAR